MKGAAADSNSVAAPFSCIMDYLSTRLDMIFELTASTSTA